MDSLLAKMDFHLGDWTVRTERCCIERDGDAVHIKPKSMAVLARLAQASGQVVGRRELFDDIWPGSEVTDDVLTQCVVEIRRAFGDSAREARIVETIPRVGFRLVPPVSPHRKRDSESERSASPSRTVSRPAAVLSMLLLVALLAMAVWYPRNREDGGRVGRARTLAVLPFVDMSAEGDQGHFTDGLTEELINRLSQLQGLAVTGRTSSFHFRGRNGDLREIGETLGVGHVLEGSVRRAGQALRITAQLIDVDSGFHLWSETFDRQDLDVFAIQDEIAEAVAKALSIRLQVGLAMNWSSGTTDVAAYEEALKGFQLTRLYTPESIQRAVSHLRRATEIDPGFAQAWVGLAQLYGTWNPLMFGRTDAGSDWESLANAALAEAMRLAPDSLDVLEAQAFRYIHSQQWLAADQTLERASALSAGPRLPTLHARLDLLAKAGRAEEALALLARERQLDPMSRIGKMYGTHLSAMLGHTTDALVQADADFSDPGFQSLKSHEGLVVALSDGDPEAIERWLARAVTHQQPGDLDVHATLSDLIGRPDAARRWLETAYAERRVADYWIAIWAAYFDDPHLSLAALERTPDAWAYWLPLTREVRRLPEFAGLLEATGLVAYWNATEWGDFCAPNEAGAPVCR